MTGRPGWCRCISRPSIATIPCWAAGHAVHHPQPRVPGRVLALRHADDGLGWDPLHARRPRVLRTAELLKGGLVFSDLLTTVSRTYAQEIRTAAFGNGSRECWRSAARICTA
jgi:hypothetical protein